MTVTIKKFCSPHTAHGRGVDNYRTPAKYDILVDGAVRGKLWGQSQRFMEKPVWEIALIDAAGVIRPLKTIWQGGKKAAVAWINGNAKAFLEIV